jgi:hypothetical protein
MVLAGVGGLIRYLVAEIFAKTTVSHDAYRGIWVAGVGIYILCAEIGTDRRHVNGDPSVGIAGLSNHPDKPNSMVDNSVADCGRVAWIW